MKNNTLDPFKCLLSLLSRAALKSAVELKPTVMALCSLLALRCTATASSSARLWFLVSPQGPRQSRAGSRCFPGDGNGCYLPGLRTRKSQIPDSWLGALTHPTPYPAWSPWHLPWQQNVRWICTSLTAQGVEFWRDLAARRVENQSTWPGCKTQIYELFLLNSDMDFWKWKGWMVRRQQDV